MTLIQTVLCRDLMIQVSDRRLTTTDGKLFDDSTNKAVLWCNTISIGFTGIAFIDSAQVVPTSRFITEALVGVDINNLSAGIETLRVKMQEAVNALPPRFNERRLTITANGPAMRNGKLVGVSFMVSNFELPDRVMATAQREFVTGYLCVEKVINFEYICIGAQVPLQVGRDCRRGVSSALRAKDLNRAVRMLVETQRRVAAVNTTVGGDALVVALPRAVDEVNSSILMSNFESSTLTFTSPTFTYMPAGSFDHHIYGPNTVCGDTALGALEMKADPDNLDKQSVSVQIIALPDSPAEG